MADYIRREDVLEFSRIFADKLWETGGYRNCITEAVPVKTIKNIPSADVAEVVRCKDCIHRPIHMDGKQPDSPYIDDDCCYRDYTCPYLCDDYYYNRMPDDNWFCNHGERKDDGT